MDTHVIERFGQAGVPAEHVTMTKETFLFRSPDTDAAPFVDLFRRFYGPTMNAFAAAEQGGKVEDLHQQLLALAEGHNQHTGGGVAIPATFLRVTVSR